MISDRHRLLSPTDNPVLNVTLWLYVWFQLIVLKAVVHPGVVHNILNMIKWLNLNSCFRSKLYKMHRLVVEAIRVAADNGQHNLNTILRQLKQIDRQLHAYLHPRTVQLDSYVSSVLIMYLSGALRCSQVAVCRPASLLFMLKRIYSHSLYSAYWCINIFCKLSDFNCLYLRLIMLWVDSNSTIDIKRYTHQHIYTQNIHITKYTHICTYKYRNTYTYTYAHKQNIHKYVQMYI